jgi:hypothetical protein
MNGMSVIASYKFLCLKIYISISPCDSLNFCKSNYYLIFVSDDSESTVSIFFIKPPEDDIVSGNTAQFSKNILIFEPLEVSNST